MLTVREEQFEFFERHFFEDALRRVERAIGSAFPELSSQPDSASVSDVAAATKRVKAIVQRGIENAVGLDIDDGPDFAAFIALGLALRLTPPGPEADWIHDWLNRADAPGQTKLRMIESRLRSAGQQHAGLASISERIALARERFDQ